MSEPARTCLNCGTPAGGRFCSSCGQELDEHRGPLSRLASEFAGEVFSLESRLFRSLRDLFFRPGALTRSYLAGRRASQVPPVRLYLVASLVFFFLFFLTPPDVSDTNVYVGDQVIGRAEPDPDATGTIRLLESSDSPLSRYLEPRLQAQREKFRAADPQQLVNQIYEALGRTLPRTLILFLPLVALILKLLYVGSRRLYYDHFIFALHAQSFFFFFLSLSWFAPLHALLWLLLFLLVAPVYLFVGLRRVYGEGRLRTLTKTAVLVLAYLAVAVLVFGGTVSWVLVTL